MRVCHVVEAAGGGSGQVVFELARYGLEHGDDVTVCYAPDRAEAGFVAALESLPRLRLLPSPMHRPVGLHDFYDGWLLWKTLRRAGPFDIIHGHSSKAGALTRLAGVFLPGTVVYTAHAFYSMKPDTPAIYGWLERILSWLTPCVINVSKGELEHSRGLGIAPSKLFLVPNGATPHFSASREQARLALKAKDGQILCGFVGRLEAQKKPLRALAAFAQAVKLHPQARLILIGDGSLREEVEAERIRLNLQDHCEMLGACDARKILPGFDCLLNSSDFETLPITFLESLNVGAPVIAPPVGGVEEAIIEGVTGFVAQDFSEKALGDALERYLSRSAEQRQQMSASTLQHAALYTAEIMGEKYKILYRALIP